MKNSDVYMKEVDLIFSILDKIENNWKNADNLALIEELRKYRDVLVNIAPIDNNKKDLEILDVKKVDL